MRRTKILTALGLLVIAVFTTQIKAQSSATFETKVSAAVRAVIDAQREAWNRGDVKGYMDGYARSPKTIFVSGESVTHGWQTVLEHYQKSYNTKEKMGTLTFSDLEITRLGKDTAVVIGRWHLQRTKDEPHGRFTLVFRKTRQGWKIVLDHTTSA